MRLRRLPAGEVGKFGSGHQRPQIAASEGERGDLRAVAALGKYAPAAKSAKAATSNR